MSRQGHALRRARSMARDERLITALADTEPHVQIVWTWPTAGFRCRYCSAVTHPKDPQQRLAHRPGCAWVAAHQRLNRPLPAGHTTQETQP